MNRNVLFNIDSGWSNVFKCKSIAQNMLQILWQMRTHNICNNRQFDIKILTNSPHESPPSQSARMHGSPMQPFVIAFWLIASAWARRHSIQNRWDTWSVAFESAIVNRMHWTDERIGDSVQQISHSNGSLFSIIRRPASASAISCCCRWISIGIGNRLLTGGRVVAMTRASLNWAAEITNKNDWKNNYKPIDLSRIPLSLSIISNDRIAYAGA